MHADIALQHIVLAALAFALLYPALSYAFNRRHCRGELAADLPGIALLASMVFALAILCEASINPLYERVYADKLWEYRLLPLHDGNASALAVLIWVSYGVHLYFLNQTLDSRLPTGARRNLYKAILIGAEAPLLWEVFGNAFFLLLVGEFYAYYNPGELFHFTSLRVVPIYALCVYLGLLVYDRVRAHAQDWRVSAAFFGFGGAFLFSG
ncbi:MAG: hypothetical protein ABR553_09350 [Gammaproteobacteria bacterium]